MAVTERDEKVSAGYRALGSDEPPRALDEAILAAARRRPSRWRVPLSIAAVLVLAVGVTLRMLPQRPDAESVALAPQVMPTPRPAAPAPAAEAAKPVAPAPSRELARAAAPAASASDTAKAAAPAPVQEGARPAARAAAAADAAVAGAAAEPRMRAESAAKLSSAPLTPEVWLARIAELRKEGRTREADESLAEFRKRYPDYKIPESLR